jgi:hypothetical protein
VTGGHVFISYARNDAGEVDKVEEALAAAGIPVWRDTAQLWPGDNWRLKIRQALAQDALVVVVCFSGRNLARAVSYQNEELASAIEQLRLRRPDVPWLIPVRFDDCEIPDLDIGGGHTLGSLQRADLFGTQIGKESARLVEAVRRILHRNQPAPAGDSGQRLADSRSARADGASDGRTDRIVIELTQGNINNNHIYLRKHLDFFPADAIGTANAKTGSSPDTPNTIHDHRHNGRCRALSVTSLLTHLDRMHSPNSALIQCLQIRRATACITSRARAGRIRRWPR